MSRIINLILVISCFFVFGLMGQTPVAVSAQEQQALTEEGQSTVKNEFPGEQESVSEQAAQDLDQVQAAVQDVTATPAVESQAAAETFPVSDRDEGVAVSTSSDAKPAEGEIGEPAVPIESTEQSSSKVDSGASKVPTEQVATESVPTGPVPTQEQTQEPAQQEVAPEDFDTSKLKEYGGNWYFKQGWWQRAEREYEKARQVMDQIFESRMEFFERQSSLDRNLFDPFYQEIGFERGELQDIIDLLVDKINEERKNEGMLDIAEREFLAKLQAEKTVLEQLKLNVELVNKYDAAISTAINELLKQLNQARQYEQVAWQEFKAIAEDLNDVVARSRFYAVKTQHKNIKNIFEYLQGSFKEYFDKLETNAKKEIDRVKEGIKALKGRGIDLKEEAQKLIDEEKGAKKTAATENADVGEAQPGIIMRLLYGIAGFFKSLWNLLFGWIYRI